MKKWQKLTALFTCLCVLVAFTCSDIATKTGADDRFAGTGVDISGALNNVLDLDTNAPYYVFKAAGNGLYTFNFKGHADMKDLRFQIYDAKNQRDLIFFNMQWITQPDNPENKPEYVYEYNLAFEGEANHDYYLKMLNQPEGMEKVSISCSDVAEPQINEEGKYVIPAKKFGTVTFTPEETSVYLPVKNVGEVFMVEYDFDTVYYEANGDEVTTTTVAPLNNTGKYGYTLLKGKTYKIKLVNGSDKEMVFSLEDNAENLLSVPVEDIEIEKKSQITYSVCSKNDTTAGFAYAMSDKNVEFDAYAFDPKTDSYKTIILRDDKGKLVNPEDCAYDDGDAAQYNLSLKANTNYYITISSPNKDAYGSLNVEGTGLELVEAPEAIVRPVVIPPSKPITTTQQNATTTTTKAAATTAAPPAAVNTFPPLGALLVDTKSKATFKVTMIGQEVEYVKPKNKNVKTITIPATVKLGGITYKVTSIKAKCFKGYKKLKKVTIGKNVKKIGKQAFYNCKKLKTIIFKTKLLKASKVGSKAFAKIHKKAVAKIPKKKLKAYKKFLKKKGMNGKKQKFKKA